MGYTRIKELFNNGLINKICDDLLKPSKFVEDNKQEVLQTLRTYVMNSVDMNIPAHKEYKEVLDFLDEQISNQK